MMRWLSCLVFLLLFVLSVGSPALARVATIQTTAPLQDHTQQSIQTALKDAVESAVKSAAAMRLSWVMLNQALVLGDMVAVQIVATDKDPQEQEEQDGEEGPDPTPGGKFGDSFLQPARLAQ
jgi:hypothetical protein